ncbi:LPXTG cell wall anchor domain-containing protein [Staphylococcus sp. IVB6246]|uniref:GA-like domain-containing protein n=1 Tax=Staphylococcus sp. IVB6246 TaxID=2989772 RepID=UPI0021CFCA99|nr:LPXTG cell wall anchor domain-containing protein [Staphylococcus sp. IVB6246]UXR69738.1 LPXTG cell wall anchor domain-containing protein [Staphylococcus sp. IVB6246]
MTAGETVQSNETVETPDVPATRYDAAVALSEELEKNKPYATTSGTAFRSAFRSVPTTRAADTYTGKIIGYPGDLVQKLNDPSIAVAPGNINFSPKFVDGKSKSYAFLVNSNGTITKKQLATNSSGTVVAYSGTYVELSNNAPEAYVYLSNVGIAGGHIVDAIAKVSIIPSKDGDAANTRYFFMSGRDYLSLASRNGGGAKVDLTFVEHKEQSEFDNLYNTVQPSQTTKDALLQQLDSIKGAETSVSGLLNVYDLDDYSATKSKDSRKSITFERNQVDKLYVSNETRQQSSALMELTEDKVTLTSGSGNFGGTYDNNKRVTVTFENQSQLNYTITGSGASGPAFHPDGLLLLQVPPYHVEDVSTTTGQDDQFVIHQTVPARDVRKTNTLPTNVTLGVQAPEGVKLTLKENTTSLFTADKSASTDNNLTIVPGKNGNKDLNLLKNATYYNKIYDLPITASHGLTLADIENNTSKWQALQQYYDKDEEVLKVPLTYTFDNSAQSWDNLTTDKTVAVMNVSDDIKDAFRRIDEAAAAVEEAKKADEAAKAALAEVNENGLITPTEVEKLTAAQQNAIAKKTAATNIVNQLPAAYQGDMPTTLAGLTGIDVPAVTDENENGVADNVDTLVDDAKKAVEATKDADQAAKTELAKANGNNLITPEEEAKLKDLAQKAEEAKAAAEAAVAKLPEEPQSVKEQKDTMTGELSSLDGITVPEVNDEDGNGVADDIDAQQVKEAQAAVEAAKAADQAAKKALEDFNKDGLITPTDKKELERLQEEAAAKKAEATAKVEALPEGQKGELPTELEKLDGISVPEVNDEDGNNVADDVDTLVDEAKKAVEAAKEADKVAKAALVEANENGLITPEEEAKLTDLAQKAEEAKAAAAVAKLPEAPQSVKEQKDTMTGELSSLDGITVPKINDKDGNNVADDVDALVDEAKKAVEAAKEADQAAKDALDKANENSLITPTEKAELEKLQQVAADKKAAAEEKVNDLPEDQKGDLPTELDKLEGITVPEVTDEDENGVADDVDKQREAAKAAVEEAKAADKAAKDALAKANEDGLITPTDKKELERLQEEAAAKKAAAEEKVNDLPEDQKGELPTELEKLDGITVPEVNDEDGNGVADDVDKQREAAEAAVAEAKAADKAAKDALTEANEDGLITPTEKAELERLQEEAVAKKAEATEKVEALPEDQKGELPSELDKLEGITVPEVTDEDENGVADDVDAQRAEAETAVEAAKAADKAAKDGLAKANEDGLITPTEKAELEKLQQAAADKKAEAAAKVEALPEDQKGDLPSELDKLEGITVPEVTDEDENGVADTTDAQRTDAEKAVEEAKQADQAAKDGLAKANEDGLITPTEKAELEKLQQAAADKKAEAAAKVEALPEDQKGELPSELDKLEGITVPEVTDEDENGVADDVDAQRAEAETAVEAAKAADKAAKDALTEANEDGLITPTEKAELERLQEAAAEKKAEATAKVEALPEDQKGDLPSELDKLEGITVPEVTDEDENGVADDVDAQRVEAEAAVADAKAADKAAKDALAKANEDSLITPTEKAELEKLQQAAAEKKAEAAEKVEALPEDQKGELPSELDKLEGIIVPEVTDEDENGVADTTDAQRAEAEAAVADAKAADKAAKDALTEANEDGLITLTEKAELEKLQQDAADKKAEAEAKVEALPEDQKGDLPSELDKLDGIIIPEVNDSDENGVADDTDAQRVDAEKAVEEAKQADQAAKSALAKANEDGLITPTEKAELEKLQQAAAEKKAEAEAKVEALPEGQKGDLPAELDKLDGITVPEVNDSDENGVADDTDAQRTDAEKAVEAAKAADQAAKDALAKAKEDGLITPTEKAELEKLQQAAIDKKVEATAKVEALLENQKGDLPSELEKLDGITVPEVNDADENGIADGTDAQRVDAEKAVEAAKKADQAAKDALAEVNKDGLITPTEKAELEKLQEAAADKKAEATAKVDALPEDQKGDLPSELDKLDGIIIPEVNDSDENGVADTTDAQRADAENAVEAAKQADHAAKDALAKAQADGIITPDEKAELERLQEEAAAKKAEATAKVDALPEDQKGDLPEELDKLTGIVVPEVTDKNDGDQSDKDTNTEGQQEKPGVSPTKPTEKGNDSIPVDGEIIKEEAPSHKDSEGKKQTLHELPETGQDSQQPITLFGGLITALGGLLFFRRRKDEKESK